MKVKVKNSRGELTADYFNAKDVHDFRYRALEYIAGMSEKSIIFFIDTNSAIRKLPISDITEFLIKEGHEHITEPIVKTERKMFGFLSFFRGKQKPQKTENIIAVKIGAGRLTKETYDMFLKYYDYAVCLDCEMPLDGMLKLYADEYEDFLFNKEVLKETFYDSILFTRLRTDCTDRGLENHLERISI